MNNFHFPEIQATQLHWARRPSGLLSTSEPHVLMDPLYQKRRGFYTVKEHFSHTKLFLSTTVINNQNFTYLEVNKTSIDPLLPWALNTRILLSLADKKINVFPLLLGGLVTTDCSLILKHRVKQTEVLQEWGISYYRKAHLKNIKGLLSS